MADPTSLYGGYLKASRFSRVRDADLDRALKPYKITLKQLRASKVVRGSSSVRSLTDVTGVNDAGLRHVATSNVVNRYLKTLDPKKRQKATGGK